MVITRRQKSSAMPVVVEEPKSQARKDIAPSKSKPENSHGRPTGIKGKKRPVSHLSSDDTSTPTPRRSKRHTASPLFSALPRESLASKAPPNDMNPTTEPLRNDSPASEANSSDAVAAETTLTDPPFPEATLSDLPFNDAPPMDPTTTETLQDDPAASEESLSDLSSFSPSEDDDRAIHSPFFVEGHVPRPPPSYTPTKSLDSDRVDRLSSFSTGARRFLHGVILYPDEEDATVYQRNLSLWNAIQEQNRVIGETGLELKTAALPHCEGTAMIILYLIAKATQPQIIAMHTNPQSKEYQEYDFAKDSFLKLRLLLSKREAILNPRDVGLLSPQQVSSIVKINLATFISGVFGIPGKQDIGFNHLNEHFLPILVADGKLTKEKQDLFLDLKTHAYISGLEVGGVKEDILDEIFPSDLDQQLLVNRGGATARASRDADFIRRCMRRCRQMKKIPNTSQGIDYLKKKLPWENYLLNLSSWLKKNFESLTGETFETRAQIVHNMRVTLQCIEPSEVMEPSEAEEAQATDSIRNTDDIDIRPISKEDEIAEKAARAADLVMQDFGSPTAMTPIPQAYPQIHFQQPIQQDGYYIFDNTNQSGNSQQNTHPEQPEASLQTQYQQARLTANTKSSPIVRRPGTPSSRRPWTTEEETALMQGLDDVGPHWSQILALYGGDGTVNKVLKDRNQVQLKDKARNLKLWFLKQGKPVPESLSQVTGELKTRAPSLASRQSNSQLGFVQASGYPQTSAAAASSPSSGRGRETPSQFPTNFKTHPRQSMTQDLNQTPNLGNTLGSHEADTAFAGQPDVDLEAALAAAERAGLESSTP